MAWQVGTVASGVIGIAYLAISVTILAGLSRAKQLRTNPLGVATGLIFLSCGVGHATHLEHMLFGSEVEAARVAMDAHMAWVDTITAIIGVTYWSLRTKFGALLAPTLFGDEASRARQAVVLHGTVLQHLITAQAAIAAGKPEVASSAVDQGVVAARGILEDLDVDVVRVA